MSGIRVTYSGLISFATGIVNVFTGLIFMIIVTRTLSPHEFGVWSLINSLLFYGMVLDPIISNWVTREIARGIGSGKTAILSSGVFSISGIFIYIVSTYFVGQQLPIDQSIILFAVSLIPFRYMDKILTTINAGWKPQLVSYATLFSEIIKIPMGLIFIYFLELGIWGVILAYMVTHLTSNIIQIIYARDKLKDKIKKEFLKKWLRLSWLSLYQWIPSFLSKSDVVIFSVITGSVLGLAYYSAALVIANIVGLAGGIASSVAPKLLEGSKKGIQENLTILFYFAIPLAALSVTFARAGLFTLNPLYAVAATVVIFMTFRSLSLILSVVFSNYLVGTERVDADTESNFKDYIKSKLFFLPTLRLIQYAVYVGALAVVLLLLAPSSSQLDLVIYWSIIALATQIPFTIYLYMLVRRNFTITLDFINIFKYLLATIGVFGMIYVLTEKFLDYKNNIFEFLPSLLLFVGLGIGGYLVITYFVSLRTRKLFKSIIHEISEKK